MKQEVVEAKKQEVIQVMTQDQASLWQNDEVSSSDIIIPRVLAMQGLSEFVTEGKAKFGDLMNSLTVEKLGDTENPVEFIPFYLQKLLKISKLVGKKYALDHFEPLTPVNENLPWEDIIGVDKIRREHVYNCFAIIPGEPLPFCISFKGTSKKAGKKVATEMYAINVGSKKIPPCSTVMQLNAKKQQNDDGTFVVLDVVSKSKSTPEQINECAKWINIVKSGSARVQEEEANHEDKPASRTTTKDLEF